MAVRYAMSVSIACITLLSSAGAAPVGTDDYVFVEDLTRWVFVVRGSWYLSGSLDMNGSFLEEGERIPRGSPHSGPIHILNDFASPTKVYEFRSGRLIVGEIQLDGSFVPEAGSKVMMFKDFKYSPDRMPIWNLPGRFVKISELTESDRRKLKPADK